MRSTLFIFTIILSVSIGCKSKQAATTSTASSNEQSATAGKTLGKVSHQYQSTGCSTVIVIPASGENGPITLIPKDKLSKDLDVDGLDILFDYTTLRMPQPAGCSVGIPAELSNVKKAIRVKF